MSKTVPSNISLPPLGKILSPKVVFAQDWIDLNQALNFHFGATGAVIGGMTFRPGWETTSTSYATANEETAAPGKDYDLDDWQGLYRPTRQAYSSGDKYMVDVNAYVDNLTLRATFVQLTVAQSGSPPQTDTTTVSTSTVELSDVTGSGTWVRGNIEFASSVSDWMLVYVEAKVPVSGTGRLHHFGMRERFITSGLRLPRGS